MDINNVIISEDICIRDAIKALDKGAKQILLVANDKKLKGVITDGDIRRWILRNGDLSTSVREIVNYSPKYIIENEKGSAKEIMKKFSIKSLPVIDINGNIVSILFLDDIELTEDENKSNKLDLPVVIMAGGLGTRLYPYTKILPKPLIPIGDTPIIERIINKFNNYGCKEFYLTVNYKKNMIKSYFGELDKNYEVSYVEEDKPLGTGGSLYLLKNKLNSTFFVSNCDVLIDADYNSIYEEHKKSKNMITIICAMKNVAIPYGVIDLNAEGKIQEMREKPEYSFLTNTGMYVIEAEVLDMIKDNEFIHLPDIVQKCMDKGMNVGVYPITESAWMDMGQHEEMQLMIERLGV